MNEAQDKVAMFMRAAGQPVAKDHTVFPEMAARKLAIALLQEELEELREGFYLTGNIVDVYDALCDMLYVILWVANAFGLDMEKGFNEVHASNMTKFIDGYREKATGKWQKGASFVPPDLARLLKDIKK